MLNITKKSMEITCNVALRSVARLSQVSFPAAALLVTALLMSGVFSASAQMNYTLSRFAGAYVPVSGSAISITGGTGVNNFSTTGGVSNENEGAAHLALPFNFTYSGTNYLVGSGFVGVCTNGYVYFTLNNTNAGKIIVSANNLSSGTNPIIAPWWDDLQLGLVNGITGTVKYETTGTAPNRVMTIEFGNFPAFASGNVKALNFQVKLYETTNEIEFMYGPVANTGTIPNQFSTSESASIGIKNATGGHGQYIDAVTGSSVVTSSMVNSNYVFARHYRFSPMAPTPLAAGTYTVGIGQTYATLAGAVADINHRGITGGNVVLQLTDATYDTTAAGGSNIFPVIFGPVAGTSSASKVIVQPVSGTATLRYRGTTAGGNIFTAGSTSLIGTGNEPVVGLVGSDFIELRNLHLTTVNAGLAGSNGVVKRGLLVANHTATDGATNNLFQDITVSLNKTWIATTIIAIQQNTIVTPTAASGANSNNRYLNLNIPFAAKGIELLGNATNPDVACEIGTTSSAVFNTIGSANDTIGGSTALATQGIRVNNQSGVKVYNNHVRNVISTGAIIDGIWLDLGQGVSSVHNNRVEGVRNFGATSTSTVYGIRSNLATTGTHESRVYNNLVLNPTHAFTGTAIATRRAIGIIAQANGSGATTSFHRIEFNTVRMQNDVGFTASSACFEIGTTSGAVMIVRNNIFADFSPAQSGAALHTAWQSTSATSIGNTGSISDYNNLYVANTTNGPVGIGSTTQYSTLANWQGMAAGVDAASKTADPAFAPLTFKTGAPSLNGAADPAYATGSPWVTTDHLDVTRNIATDIGAFEFDVSAIDMAPTALAQPAAAPACYSSAQQVVVTIRNFGLAPIDFSVDNTTVTANVIGAVSQVLAYTLIDNTLNPGGVPLAVGASMDVTVGTLNMSTLGTYNFAVSTAVTGDGNTSNDNLSPVPTRTVNPVAGGTAAASPASICVSGNATLSVSGQSTGATITWYSGPAGTGPWTTLVGTGNNLSVPITATLGFKAEVTCNTTTTTNEVVITYNNPMVSSTTPGSRCGTGSVALGATTAGAGLNWYAASTGGASLGSGTTFNTPSISTTTSFWVGANNGGSTSNTAAPTKGQNTGYTLEAGLFFDVTSSFTLDGVYVYAIGTGAGTVDIALKNSAGTNILTTTVNLTGVAEANTVKTYVPLNWLITPGTDYSLNMMSRAGLVSALVRDAAGVITGGGFPFVAPGVLSIKSGRCCPAAVSTSYYYFYDWQITTGCEGARTEVVATVTAPPAISPTVTSSSICAGQSSQINVTSGNGGYSYVWSSTPSGTNETTAGPHTVTPSVNTTYNVTATDGGTGCVNTGSVNVTVNSNPAAPVISPAAPIYLCDGQSVNLQVPTGSNPKIGSGTLTSVTTTPYKGNWGGNRTQYIIPASELTTAGLVAGSSINTIGYEITSYTGPYTFNGFNIKMGHTLLSTLTTTYETAGMVQVLNPVSLVLNTSGAQVTSHALNTPFVWDGTSNLIIETCFNNNDGGGVAANSATIQYTSVTGSTLYRQLDSDPNVCTTLTGLVSALRPNTYIGYANLVPTWNPGNFSGYTYSPSPNTTTLYSATVTNAAGCTASSTRTVNVDPVPTAFNMTGGGSYCAGEPGVVVGLDGSEAGVNYQLKRNGVNAGVPVAGNGAALNFGLQTVAGSYTVNALSASGACNIPMSGTAVVTVNVLPTASVTGGGTRCSSEPLPDVIISLTGTSPWSIDYSDGTSTFNVTNIIASPYVIANAAPGTYSVTSVTGGAGCVNAGTGSVQVIQNPTPGLPGIVTPVTYCQFASASQLSATGTALLWYAGPTGGTGSATAPTPVTSAAGTTLFYVTQTVNGCESSRAQIEVDVNQVPDIAVIAPVQNICPTPDYDLSTLSYTDNNAAGGTASFHNTLADAQNNINPISTIYNTIGMNTLYLRVTTAAGCWDVEPFDITINNCNCSAQPTANAGADFTICGGTAAMAGSFTNATQITWSGGTGTFSNINDPLAIYTPGAGEFGPVILTMTTDNPLGGACVAAVSQVTVTISANPTSVITGDMFFCPGGSAALSGSTSTAGNGTIAGYEWQSPLGTAVGTGVNFNALVAGDYYLLVSNSDGCTNTSAAYNVTLQSGPLAGTYTVGAGPTTCTNFATVAEAVNAVNTRGLSANVIMNVSAGFTGNAPVGGYQLNQCGLLPTSLKTGPSQTLTFQKSGAGANPKLIAQTGVGSNDVIFSIIGMDYVTIDGIDLEANPANSDATTRAEMGYLLAKCSSTDGAQNNTIKNCNITLNKANTNNTVAIYSINADGALLSLPATSSAGTNSGNRIYSNTISNTFHGIIISGTNDAAPYAFYDHNNEIGAIGQGNTITNLGRSTAAANNTAFGILVELNNNAKVTGNTINSNGGLVHSGAIEGIRTGFARAANVEVKNNTITLANSATGANSSPALVYGINFLSGTRASRFESSTNTTTIDGNIIQNCNLPAGARGSFRAIMVNRFTSDSLQSAVMNITNNQILNNSAGTDTTNAFVFLGIMDQQVHNTLTISGNTLSGNNITGTTANSPQHRMIVTGWGLGLPATNSWQQSITVSDNTLANNSSVAAGGAMTGITVENYVTNSQAPGSVCIVNGNTVGNVTIAAVQTATYSAIINGSANNVDVTMNNNVVTNVTRNAATTGAFDGIRSTATTPVGVTMTGNTVSNINMTGGVSAAFTAISQAGSTSSTQSVVMNNNNVNAVTHNGTGAMTCIDAGNAVSYTVTGNTVTGNLKTTATTGVFNGITSAGSTTLSTNMNMSGNIVTNNTQQGTSDMTLLYANGAVNYAINNNQVFGNVKAGASGTMFCTRAGGGSTSVLAFNNNQVYNNSMPNTTGTTAALLYGYYNFASTGVSESYQNNQVYNLSMGGTNTATTSRLVGIYSGTSVNSARTVSNNLVHSIASNVTGIGAVTVAGIVMDYGSAASQIFKNKIYNLASSNSGTTNGIVNGIGLGVFSATIAGNATVYNNTIGDLMAPNSAATDAVRGISILQTAASSGYNLYFNSIHLNAASVGANFGTSGVFHTASATATTSALDMRNNVVVNKSIAAGTGRTVAYRRSSTSIANYNPASNNNLFWVDAGASHNIYSDGTNHLDLAAYKALAGVAPRDAQTATENVTFQSTSGASVDFLKVNTTVPTLIEGGAQAIMVPVNITDDFFGSVRNTTSPDIGAHEDNFVANALTINSIAANPPTGQCSAVPHVVTANVTAGPLPIASVTLNYAFDGIAQPAITMSVSGVNEWQGTIPAATPVNALVTWSVTATDGVNPKSVSGIAYEDVPLVVTANANPTSVCDGSTTLLFASSPAFIPTLRWTELMFQGWIASGYSGFTPSYITVPGGTTMDIFEITNLGTGSVDPAGVTFEQWTTASTTAPLRSITVPAGASLVPSGGSMFLMANSSNPVSNPANNVYKWGPDLDQGSGTAAGFIIKKDGVIIDAAATNSYAFPTASGVTTSDWAGNMASNSGQNGSVLVANDNNTASTWATTGTAGPKSSYGTINFGVTATLVGSSNLAISWSDGLGFNASGVQVTSPAITAASVFTVTVSDGVCNATSSVTINVLPVPAPPTAFNTTQCGTGLPTAYVTGTGGTFKWYDMPNGGTLLQTGGSSFGSPVSANTTWYVSETVGGCESPRTPLTQTVIAPDAVSINVTSSPLCGLGGSVSLTAVSANANYAYNWSAPVAARLTPTSGASVTMTPTAFNTYTINVSANDPVSGCFTIAQASVEVLPAAIAGTASASGAVVCPGSPATLTLTGSSGNIQWQKFDGAAWVNQTGPGSNTASYSFVPSGNFDYRAVVTSGSCPTDSSNVVNMDVKYPVMISTADDTRCGTGTLTLQANPEQGANAVWYDQPAGGSAVYTGNAFVTPILTASKPYYVSAVTGGGFTNTGMPASLPTATSGSGTTNFGIVFDVLSAFNLQSVTVYPVSPSSASGTVTIDVINGAGAVLHTMTASVTGSPAASPVAHVINLNFNLLPGTNLKMRPGFTGISGLLFEPSAAAPAGNYGYPYVVPGVLTINTSTLTAAPTNTARNDLYYYFYNWVVSAGCESPRVLVNATVTPAVPISASATATTICEGGAADVSAISANGNYGYTWSSTPAGFSAVGAGPHTVSPSSTTIYTVVALDPNDSCQDIRNVTVNVNPVPVATASAATSLFCGNGTTALSVSDDAPVGSAYSISNVAHSPVATPGSGYTVLASAGAAQVSMTSGSIDDGYWSSITLPFPFSFFGTVYNNVAINTNGYLNIGSVSLSNTGYNVTLPATGTPNNTVSGMQADFDFTAGGALEYFTAGTAPNRRFVVSYSNVPFWISGSPGTNGNATFQIHLLEGSNAVEVHTSSIAGNTTTTKTQGIENAAGTVAHVVTGRNNQTTWTGLPDAYRFSLPQPYTYSWSPAAGLSDANVSNPVATVSSTTTYVVTVTNAATGCFSTTSVTLTVEAIPTPIITQSTGSNPLCTGQTATLNSGYSDPSFTYAWSNFNNQPNISVSAPGDYTVTVTTALAGCVGTSAPYSLKRNILSAVAVVTSNYNGAQVSCFGASNGSFNINATSLITTPSVPSPGPLRYSVNGGPFQSSNAFTGLPAGTHTFVVNDLTTGCSFNGVRVITSPAALTVSAVVNNHVACFGGNEGSATATALGGTGALSFSWKTPAGVTAAIGAMPTGLAADTYTVTVTDANGCTATASVTITQPSALSVSIAVPVTMLCGTASTGSATATAAGGSGSYSYAWTSAGGYGSTDAGVSGLGPDVYTVTVTDANGCTASSAPFTLNRNILSAGAAVASNYNNYGVSCAGATNGTVMVNVISFILPSFSPGGPYTYSINGATPQSGNTFNNLGAGTYTVTVYDLTTGCSATATSVTITEPSPLTASTLVNNQVSCFGGSNGSATVNTTGGIPGYTFEWFNAGGVKIGTDGTQGGMSSGSYTVTVTDANGCSITLPVTITQPPLLTVTLNPNQVVFYGGPGYNGCTTLSATPAGGTPGFTYQWRNMNSSAILSSVTSSQQVCVPSGITKDTLTTYQVTVTDSKGCTATATVIINYININCSTPGTTKIQICHVPTGNTSNCKTLCIAPDAWPGLYGGAPLSYLGKCKANCQPPSARTTPDYPAQMQTELKVYPNPTSSRVHVEYMSDWSEAESVVLIDMQGRVVMDLQTERGMQIRTELDLSALKDGIYFINVMNNGSVVKSAKVIKTE